MPRPDRRTTGFTLTEVGITILLLGATLGIVVPVLLIEQERSLKELAMEQANQIGEPIVEWYRDCLPVVQEGGPAFLAGPGRLSPPLDPLRRGDLGGAMKRGLPPGLVAEGSGWNGPYLESVPIDPWGHSYVLLGIEHESDHLWVISAGPDQVLQTNASHRSLQGDDCGIRMR